MSVSDPLRYAGDQTGRELLVNTAIKTGLYCLIAFLIIHGHFGEQPLLFYPGTVLAGLLFVNQVMAGFVSPITSWQTIFIVLFNFGIWEAVTPHTGEATPIKVSLIHNVGLGLGVGFIFHLGSDYLSLVVHLIGRFIRRVGRNMVAPDEE